MDQKTEYCWYHTRVGRRTEVATHYVRHYCPVCERVEIIAVCKHCHDTVEFYLRDYGNYPWECEHCSANMERRIIGKVNDG